MDFEIDFLMMNISAAIMIFIVAFIRNCVKNKVPHFLVGLMWAAVVFRLYVPYHFATEFNIYNVLYYIRGWIAKNDFFQVGYDRYYFDKGIREILQLPEVRFFIIAIWLLGSVFIWRYFLSAYQVAEKIWKTAEPSSIEKEVKTYLSSIGLKKEVMIRESPLIQIPVARGVFHHGIILPTNFKKCNQQMIHQVFLHEYMHLKYWHPLIQHIAVLVLCLNWFNPAIWVFYFLIRRDLEMACDKHVVQILGEEERESYAMNLIFLAKSENRNYAFYNGFVRGSTKRIIQERIVAIMKYKKLSTWAVVMAMLLPTGVASAMGTNSNYVFGDEIKQESMQIDMDEEILLEAIEIEVSYEELQPYIMTQETKAVSKLVIENFERTYTTSAIPVEIKVTLEKYGYKYSGTLELVNVKKSGSSYIGYYSGTAYRQ